MAGIDAVARGLVRGDTVIEQRDGLAPGLHRHLHRPGGLAAVDVERGEQERLPCGRGYRGERRLKQAGDGRVRAGHCAVGVQALAGDGLGEVGNGVAAGEESGS